MGIYLWDSCIVQYMKIQLLYHIYKTEDKNHMIISIVTEKTFDTTQAFVAELKHTRNIKPYITRPQLISSSMIKN